jgi:hypothetical protein
VVVVPRKIDVSSPLRPTAASGDVTVALRSAASYAEAASKLRTPLT